MKGSGARSSVRTTVVPVDDWRLDIEILGSGGRSFDTSMIESEAVSSNTMLGLLTGLLMRREVTSCCPSQSLVRVVITSVGSGRPPLSLA